VPKSHFVVMNCAMDAKLSNLSEFIEFEVKFVISLWIWNEEFFH